VAYKPKNVKPQNVKVKLCTRWTDHIEMNAARRFAVLLGCIFVACMFFILALTVGKVAALVFLIVVIAIAIVGFWLKARARK